MPLPRRPGLPPTTTPTNPHMQLDQQPAGSKQRDLLATAVFALAGVVERSSLISVPGARALWLVEDAKGPPEGFMIGQEFAHLHPGPDQSLHMMLPPQLAEEAIEAGWAEQHPVAREGPHPGQRRHGLRPPRRRRAGSRRATRPRLARLRQRLAGLTGAARRSSWAPLGWWSPFGRGDP